MENQFFFWKTNPDYADMLNMPITNRIVSDMQNENIEKKRVNSRKKRKKKTKAKRRVR